MKEPSVNLLRAQLGADRVLAPANALPQPAERLDPGGPVRPTEFEVAVERLCLDSTSFRNLRERSDGDPQAMAARILEIVSERGKMHNPETDSGGVLLGTVTAVGDQLSRPPGVGDRVVTLASLTLTPLHLSEIVSLDPQSAQIEVVGTAYMPDRAPWGPVPGDLPLSAVVELYDVYAAASHTRALAPENGTVCVLGTGHAGKLALAAARDALGAGTVVAVDVDAAAVARMQEVGLCDIGIAADLRDPLGALDAVYRAGVGPADLTVAVVNATRCEPAAIVLTADSGTILFFSMATNFSTAALTADGMSSNARMIIGSGFAPDVGAYALELARRSNPLRIAMGLDR